MNLQDLAALVSIRNHVFTMMNIGNRKDLKDLTRVLNDLDEVFVKEALKLDASAFNNSYDERWLNVNTQVDSGEAFAEVLSQGNTVEGQDISIPEVILPVPETKAAKTTKKKTSSKKKKASSKKKAPSKKAQKEDPEIAAALARAKADPNFVAVKNATK